MRMQKSLERIHRQLKSQKTGEEYSLSSVVSDALQAEDIFLSHEIIRPNSRSSAPHFHIATDEIIYVLEGTVIASNQIPILYLIKVIQLCLRKTQVNVTF